MRVFFVALLLALLFAMVTATHSKAEVSPHTGNGYWVQDWYQGAWAGFAIYATLENAKAAALDFRARSRCPVRILYRGRVVLYVDAP
jgi:hypothetical protein